MEKSRTGKNSKGITLVALVVTIVVLLILAGITIMYIMGENSVFKQAGDAKLNTELAKIEEQASLIYTDKLLQKAQNNNNLKEKPTMQEIVGELTNKGYTIERIAASGSEITGMLLDKESMNVEFGKTKTIQVTLEGNNEPYMYFTKLDEKYYEMHLNSGVITIDRTESDVSEGEGTAPTLTVASGDETIATVSVNNDTNRVIVTATDKAGTTVITVTYGEYTKSCNITVREESDWEEIAEIAKAITSDNNITSSSIEATVTVNGESKTIKVGEIYKIKYNGEIKQVRVLGFKHDDLVNTGVYGGNHTKAGISFEFMDCLGTHNMNGTNNSDSTNTNGWAATEMRTYLESAEVRGKLSNNNYIKQVKKQYIKIYNDASSNNNYSNDYLWLLAASEIYATGYQSGAYAFAIATEGAQYQYYKGINPEWNSNNTNLMKKLNGNESNWWLRSPYYNNSNGFCGVDSFGNRNAYGSYYVTGVVPCFSI